MDYEKAYKESFEAAKGLHEAGNALTKKQMEIVFPQLAESEDERIRKWIYTCIENLGYPADEDAEKELEEMQPLALVWLEKQKEITSVVSIQEAYRKGFNNAIAAVKQKPEKYGLQKDASKAIEAVERIDKYIDEHLANAHDMKDSNPDKKYYRGWDDALGKMAGILQDVYSEEKQKEQKPVQNPKKGCPTYPLSVVGDLLAETPQEPIRFEQKQKPAEWSKNDTAFLAEITDFFENKTVRLQHDLDMYAHWLKSLPERFNLQPKQEWSEEDEERLINTSISFLKDFADKGYENAVECIDWLKSLRPQPHWKPSEEQMEAFRSYIKDFQARAEAAVGGWNNFDVMIRLFEQLKGLM